MENEKSYTLITGATGVLGGEFARQCLSRGESLILTGRNEEKLTTLKNSLLVLSPTADIVCHACDLTDEGQRQIFFAYIDNCKISCLINVAGADIQKAFADYTMQKVIFQTRICFESAVACCYFAIKHKAQRLSIINISSVSGIYPMPYFAIYSATKGALTNFSVALNSEMKGQGVSVTAILPGAIYTREDVIEYIKTQGLWGKIATKSPQFVVRKSLVAAKRHRVKVVVGFANKLMNLTTKLVPTKLREHFIAKKWSKTTKDAF